MNKVEIISDLPVGLYYLNIQLDSGEIINRRVIKE